MAQKTQAKTLRHLALAFIISIAGLLLIIVSYRAVMTSADVRSKAASLTQTVKRWDFNGTTTEGWEVAPFLQSSVSGGRLWLHWPTTPDKNVPFIKTALSNIILPWTGTNYLKIRLGIGPKPDLSPAPNCNITCKLNSLCQPSLVCFDSFCRNPSCPTQSNCVCATSSPRPTPVPSLSERAPAESMPLENTVTISYRIKGKTAFEKPVSFSLSWNQLTSMYEASIRLPADPREGSLSGNVYGVPIDLLQISFSFRGTDKASILVDWIELVNQKDVSPTPTPIKTPPPPTRPTPTPTCTPRPACLDASPPCKLAPAIGVKFCPPTPTTTKSNRGFPINR